MMTTASLASKKTAVSGERLHLEESPGHYLPPGTPISASNNWGLGVDRDPEGNGPGTRTYALVASLGATAFAAPGQRIKEVVSSKLASLNLIVGAADGDCPIPPLDPLVDPEAIRFEAADGDIVTYEDLNGVNQMDSSMLPDGGGDVGHIECLNQAVTDAGGQFELESAWRAPAYQYHLQDVYNKNLELQDIDILACNALKAEVADEMAKHKIQFTGPRGRATRHTAGQAIDISTDWGLLTGSGSIDDLATACGLQRLSDPEGDPGHFSLDGK